MKSFKLVHLSSFAAVANFALLQSRFQPEVIAESLEIVNLRRKARPDIQLPLSGFIDLFAIENEGADALPAIVDDTLDGACDTQFDDVECCIDADCKDTSRFECDRASNQCTLLECDLNEQECCDDSDCDQSSSSVPTTCVSNICIAQGDPRFTLTWFGEGTRAREKHYAHQPTYRLLTDTFVFSRRPLKTISTCTSKHQMEEL